MTSGALKLKERKYFSRPTFVIYIFLYTDDKNICDSITWEGENIKVIGLIGTIIKMGGFSTFTIHLGQDMHFQYWDRYANYVWW